MKTQNALLPASPTLVVEDKHMALVAETTSVPLTAWPAVSDDSVERFPDRIHEIAEAHQPSRMPFFRHLAALPKRKASDPALLGRIYLIYQAAMHATRAAVYQMPHLDAPAMRRRTSLADSAGCAFGHSPASSAKTLATPIRSARSATCPRPR